MKATSILILFLSLTALAEGQPPGPSPARLRFFKALGKGVRLTPSSNQPVKRKKPQQISVPRGNQARQRQLPLFINVPIPTLPPNPAGRPGDLNPLLEVLRKNADPDENKQAVEDPDGTGTGTESTSAGATGATSSSSDSTSAKAETTSDKAEETPPESTTDSGTSGDTDSGNSSELSGNETPNPDPYAGLSPPTKGKQGTAKGKLFQDDSMRDLGPQAQKPPAVNHKNRSPKQNTGTLQTGPNGTGIPRPLMKHVCFLVDTTMADGFGENVKRAADEWGRCGVAMVPHVFEIESNYTDNPEEFLRLAAARCPLATQFGKPENSIQSHVIHQFMDDEMCGEYPTCIDTDTGSTENCRVGGCAELVPPRGNLLTAKQLEDYRETAENSKHSSLKDSGEMAQSIVSQSTPFVTVHELHHNDGAVNAGDGDGNDTHGYGTEGYAPKNPGGGGGDESFQGRACEYIRAASNPNPEGYGWDPGKSSLAYFLPGEVLRDVNAPVNFLGEPGQPIALNGPADPNIQDPGDLDGLARKPPPANYQTNGGQANNKSRSAPGASTPKSIASKHKKKPGGASTTGGTSVVSAAPARPPKRSDNPVASADAKPEAFTKQFFGKEKNDFDGSKKLFQDEGLETEEKFFGTKAAKKKTGSDKLLGSLENDSLASAIEGGSTGSKSDANQTTGGFDPNTALAAGPGFTPVDGIDPLSTPIPPEDNPGPAKPPKRGTATNGDPEIFTGGAFFGTVGGPSTRRGERRRRYGEYYGDE